MRSLGACSAVSLTANQLADVLGVLDRIDQGLIHPRIPGRIGRFLRQYHAGRAQVDRVVAESKLERRADAAVSGNALGAIEIHSMLEPEVSILEFPLGEVAGTLAISEQLGGLTKLVMWLKGPVANATFNLLRGHQGVRLSGDYRWTPPARLTPGEARLEPSAVSIRWQDARCLKAAADDVVRPPHALEYVLDYRIGPPGLKYFRCVSTRKEGRHWMVLPGLSQPRPLEVCRVLPGVASALNSAEFALVLIYREPWSGAWTIADGAAVDAEGCLAHAMSWADFRRELDGSQIDGDLAHGIREALGMCGLRPAGQPKPNMAHGLLPVARSVLASLRGLA